MDSNRFSSFTFLPKLFVTSRVFLSHFATKQDNGKSFVFARSTGPKDWTTPVNWGRDSRIVDMCVTIRQRGKHWSTGQTTLRVSIHGISRFSFFVVNHGKPKNQPSLKLWCFVALPRFTTFLQTCWGFRGLLPHGFLGFSHMFPRDLVGFAQTYPPIIKHGHWKYTIHRYS